MENLVERIRNTFRRTTDRLSGQHVPVVQRSPSLENLQRRSLRSPPVDVLENDNEVLVRADVPGAFPDNTSVYWDEHSGLSLHVERAAEQAAVPLYGEDLSGDWYRAFSLPDYLDGAAARATVKAGVVTIHVPKAMRAAPTPIPITVG